MEKSSQSTSRSLEDRTVFGAQPRIRILDYRVRGGVTWERLDERASSLLGREVVAIPSVRTAALWILEYLGLSRHRDEILVPRYLGRCIINALSRRAFPAQSLSDRTKTAFVVHQFGFVQKLREIEDVFAGSGIPYVEDSPGGLDFRELCGPGSLGRLIALTWNRFRT